MIQSHKGSKERKQKFISIQLDEKSCIKNVNVGVTKYLPSSQRKLHMHWIWNTPFMASNMMVPLAVHWKRKKERKKQQTQKVECFHGVIPRVSAAPAMAWLFYCIFFPSIYLWFVCLCFSLLVWCLDPSFLIGLLICSQKSIDDCSRDIVWKVWTGC